MKVLDDPDRLLADAHAGQPDWAAIYHVVRRPMYAAVRAALRPHRCYQGHSEEDVVATAFEELMRKGLDDVTSLVGTARIVAFRRAIDIVRRPVREEPCGNVRDVVDDDDLAQELARRQHLCDRIVGLLDQLPDRQRVAIQETVMKRRSCADLADQWGVSHQAVSKLRRKGLGHLLTLLRDPPEVGDRHEEETG
jgi:RNA polymerase sigma factor (sigma-70 family)